MIIWLFSLTGAIGLAYGIHTLLRRRIEIYSIAKREIVMYTGRPAQVVSIGLITSSLAIVLVALSGFVLWPLVIVIAAAYYGGLYLANRMQDENA